MAKQHLYLLKYNNYYNRIIKGYDTLADYLDNENILYYTANEVNFNPNDGINATHNLMCGNVDADYMLCYTPATEELSRWFVLDMVRLANGQYHLTLRRDLIQDFKPDVVNAPSFIEKATIKRYDDPAIFNNEAMTFNQIKQDENALRDETKIPWIVGYIARDAISENKTITTNTPTKSVANIEVSSLAAWAWGSKINTPLAYKIDYETSMRFNHVQTPNAAPFGYVGKFTANNSYTEKGEYIFGGYMFESGYVSNVFANTIAPLQTLQYQSLFDSWMQSNLDYADEFELSALDGKIIKTIDNNYFYKISVVDSTSTYNLTSNEVIYNYTNNNINRSSITSGSATSDTWTITGNVYRKTIQLTQIFAEIGVDLEADHNRLLDAPYDMFCIPYGSIPVKNTVADDAFNTEKEAGLNMVNAIVAELGEGTVFDIQLLPYCPCRELLNNVAGRIDAYKGDCTTIYYNDTNKARLSILIWCQYSQFSFSREYNDFNTLYIPDIYNPVEKKIKNEVSFVRVCSPNYDGVFEFSPMKNNGVYSWNIDCAYRPFTPYIHVAPKWNRGSLYGNNYNDARGLICGGDFSLTQMTDAWATYQLNNKNFQASFDRQIENMELNNSIQGTMDVVNAVTGTLSGAAAGGMAGGMTGNPYAAGIGAVVGGAASMAGGIADIQLNKMLREEALDYTKDQFGYNLQNIQALPQSLRKVSALNQNNKVFPFVEYYTCSTIEAEALRNKIKYNGMTIMRIGTIADFIQDEPSYIKGKLIRLENVGDNHLVAEIAAELNQGIFI